MRNYFLALSLLCSLFLSGCSSGYVATRPPDLRYARSAYPGPGYVWTSGDWIYSGGKYHWREGTWKQAKSGATWKSGYWESSRKGYKWHKGHW